MSDHSHDLTPPAPENFDTKKLGGLPNLLLGLGAGGIVISLIGLFSPSWREQFAHSWLFGFSYFFTICVGGLFWTCLHHATDAEWSVVVRRQMENLAKLIPYFALFYLPILLCITWRGENGEGLLLKWWFKTPGEAPI